MFKFYIILCVALVGLAEEDFAPKKNRFSEAMLVKRLTEDLKFQSIATKMTLKWMSSVNISDDAISRFKKGLTNCTTRIRTYVQQKLRSINGLYDTSRPSLLDQNPECIKSIHQISDFSKSIIQNIDSYTITDLKKLVTSMRATIFWEKIHYIQKLWDDTNSCEMNPKNRMTFNASLTCYEEATATLKLEFRKYIDLLNFKIFKPVISDPQRRGFRDCIFVNELPVFDDKTSAQLKAVIKYFAMCR